MDYFNNITLLHFLPYLLTDNARLSHSQAFARALYEKLVQLFLACTEKEKRTIARSDAEFMAIIKSAIIERSGFRNEQEAFGKEILLPKIPRIKRGNELVWSSLGDPEEPIRPEIQPLIKKLQPLTSLVMQKILDFYPDAYAKSFPNPEETMTFVLNTSHVKIFSELQVSEGNNFQQLALPLIVRAIVDEVGKRYNLSHEKVNEMYESVVVASLKECKMD